MRAKKRDEPSDGRERREFHIKPLAGFGPLELYVTTYETLRVSGAPRFKEGRCASTYSSQPVCY